MHGVRACDDGVPEDQKHSMTKYPPASAAMRHTVFRRHDPMLAEASTCGEWGISDALRYGLTVPAENYTTTTTSRSEVSGCSSGLLKHEGVIAVPVAAPGGGTP